MLANRDGAARDVVCLNAGAAIYVAGLAADIAAGVEKAKQSIASGAAAERLQKLIKLSGSFA